MCIRDRYKFDLYAHNTYVSYVYEYGYLGFFTFIGLLILILSSAMKMSDKPLSKIIAFSIAGFLIMNLATMPLWNIEGLIFFALALGVVFADPKKKVVASKVKVPNHKSKELSI